MKIDETWMMKTVLDIDETKAIEIIKNAVHKILDKFDPEEGSVVLSSVSTGECFTISELRRAISILSCLNENYAWEIEG